MRRIRVGLICIGLTAIATSAIAATQQVPWPKTPSHQVNAGSTKDAVNVVKNYSNSFINSKLANWLSRTDINYAIQTDNKPVGSIETIQPLYQNSQHTLFWQGRLAYSNVSTTGNLGLGYRHLADSDKWMWGVNTFYDENVRFLHKRIGIGGEVFTSYVTFRANYYDAISGRKQVGVSTFERAVDGFDASLETPVPYIPWMRFNMQGYHWDGVTASNVNGGLANLRIFPTRMLEVDAGVAYDNSQHAQAFLKADLYFGDPAFIEQSASTSGKGKTAFAGQNLEDMRLEKVIRHNDIVVEKTSSSSGASGSIIVARGT